MSVWGTSLTNKLRRFSWQQDYLHYPFVQRLRVLSGFSLHRERICLLSSLPLQRAFVGTRECHFCVTPSLALARVAEYLTALPSASRHHRVHLRSRLTLIRLALIRNPWFTVDGFFTHLIVTHAYSFASNRSKAPHRTPSTPTGMLPYRYCYPTASADDLCPIIIDAESLTSELLRTL